MKKTKIILSITLALVMTLALCACSFELGGDETWEYKADNKEALFSCSMTSLKKRLQTQIK